MKGEEVWCQGYSEPGSGSDLASVQTRAIDDGDDFVVNGQKVWTSMAQHADMIFALVRTDPDAPKHKGISYLLIDMHSPGVTVRPLVQMTGGKGFNEVFFEDVRVPKKNIVGERNNGWQVAMTTLMFERGSGGGEGYLGEVHELARLAKRIPRNGSNAWDDSSVRQKVAEFAAEALALRYTGYRQLTRQLKGMPPGPEGSMMKLCGTELGPQDCAVCDGAAGAVQPAGIQRAVRGRQGQVVVPDAGGARPDNLRRDESDPAQHHRRAGAGTAEGLGRGKGRSLYLM